MDRKRARVWRPQRKPPPHVWGSGCETKHRTLVSVDNNFMSSTSLSSSRNFLFKLLKFLGNFIHQTCEPDHDDSQASFNSKCKMRWHPTPPRGPEEGGGGINGMSAIGQPKSYIVTFFVDFSLGTTYEELLSVGPLALNTAQKNMTKRGDRK